MTVQLHLGDCLEVMRSMADKSVDTIITDPPYGLEFMGKDWDKGVPGVAFWQAAYRVAKPGAILLAFGGTRTYHRLACAIEDAGFEIRDTIAWVYGSGFPKSLNIEKAGAGTDWHGWGTALKPAFEPIVVAMKPIDGTFVNNALTWGVAGLNIDGGRVGCETITQHGRNETFSQSMSGKNYAQEAGTNEHQGRFPANFIHDGSDEVVGLFPMTSGGSYSAPKACKRNNGLGLGTEDERYGSSEAPDNYGDSGSAARFFYCAKASRSERNAGLEGMEERPAFDNENGAMGGNMGSLSKPRQNYHPTVKPLALMRYLVRLTKTPTGGVVLDPFMGSGTTGCAAVLEGRDFIGIEIDPTYFAIAEKRIAEAQKQPRLEGL